MMMMMMEVTAPHHTGSLTHLGVWCAGSDDESDEEDDDIGSSLSDGDDEEPIDHAELIAQVTGGEVQLRRQERSEGPAIAHKQ